MSELLYNVDDRSILYGRGLSYQCNNSLATLNAASADRSIQSPPAVIMHKHDLLSNNNCVQYNGIILRNMHVL